MFFLSTSLSGTKTHPVIENYCLDLDGRIFWGCKSSLTKTSKPLFVNGLVEVSVWRNVLFQSCSHAYYVTYTEQMENRNTALASQYELNIQYLGFNNSKQSASQTLHFLRVPLGQLYLSHSTSDLTFNLRQYLRNYHLSSTLFKINVLHDDIERFFRC